MLILTRKAGQTIYIGDDVKVTILNGNRENIRVGITAPNSIIVHREEIYRKIRNREKLTMVE